MDGDDRPASSRRKVKFTPKAPIRRKETPAGKKRDSTGEDLQIQERLSKRFNETLQRQGPKADSESSAQVAIAPVASPPARHGNRRSSSGMGSVLSGSRRNLHSSSGAFSESDEFGGTSDSSGEEANASDKPYKEPWDYANSYYPTTLPLRKPNSGRPETLDKAEFEKDGGVVAPVEGNANAASTLELLVSNKQQDHEKRGEETRLMFFQFPPILPTVRQPRAKPEEKVGGSSDPRLLTSASKASGSRPPSSLEGLPAGLVGKLLIYKSGEVKLKLGEILFEVAPGTECNFPEDVVMINTKDQHCCVVGALEKRAIVTPDIESLLNMDSE